MSSQITFRIIFSNSPKSEFLKWYEEMCPVRFFSFSGEKNGRFGR